MRAFVVALEQPLVVGAVLGEEPLGPLRPAGHGSGGQRVVAQGLVLGGHGVVGGLGRHGPGRSAFVAAAPAPHVAEPQAGQHVQRRGVGAAVGDGVTDDQVVAGGLGVLGGHVEVAVLVERAGVFELVFEVLLAAAGVFFDQFGVGKLGLRVAVERLGVAVGRGRVEVVVALLDVLAVVALVAGEAEEAFFQNVVLAVPQRHAQAHAALAVGEAQQAVFAPAVDAAAGVVVGEVVPGVAVGRVVLAHGGPLPLGEIGAPPLPVFCTCRVFGQPRVLGGAGRRARFGATGGGLDGVGGRGGRYFRHCGLRYRLWPDLRPANTALMTTGNGCANVRAAAKRLPAVPTPRPRGQTDPGSEKSGRWWPRSGG